MMGLTFSKDMNSFPAQLILVRPWCEGCPVSKLDPFQLPMRASGGTAGNWLKIAAAAASSTWPFVLASTRNLSLWFGQ